MKRFRATTAISMLAIGTLFCCTACAETLKTDNAPLRGNPLYSDTLRAVLESESFDSLIHSYLTNKESSEYLAYPYAFLQKKGYDVAELKENPNSVFCRAQLRKNDLTFFLRTKTEGANVDSAYYTFYTVEYTLTNQETSELSLLFDGAYIETPFYVQTIAQTKKENVVAEWHVTATAWTQWEELLRYEDLMSEDTVPFLTAYTQGSASLTLYEGEDVYETRSLPALCVETEHTEIQTESLRHNQSDPVWTSSLITLITAFDDVQSYDDTPCDEATVLPVARTQFFRKLS